MRLRTQLARSVVLVAVPFALVATATPASALSFPLDPDTGLVVDGPGYWFYCGPDFGPILIEEPHGDPIEEMSDEQVLATFSEHVEFPNEGELIIIDDPIYHIPEIPWCYIDPNDPIVIDDPVPPVDEEPVPPVIEDPVLPEPPAPPVEGPVVDSPPVLPEPEQVDVYDCTYFTYQEDAQTVLDLDRRDPHRLDWDGDGNACEELPKRPVTETVTVIHSDPAPQAAPVVVQAAPVADSGPVSRDVHNCTDFAYQEDAQTVLDLDRRDVNRLDGNNDGIACDELPKRPVAEPALAEALPEPPAPARDAAVPAVPVTEAGHTTTEMLRNLVLGLVAGLLTGGLVTRRYLSRRANTQV